MRFKQLLLFGQSGNQAAHSTDETTVDKIHSLLNDTSINSNGLLLTTSPFHNIRWHRASLLYAEFRYTNDTIVEDLKYKNEIIGFEYDNYNFTDKLSENMQRVLGRGKAWKL